jgi:Xaa-Pro aminopeptidase
MDVDHCRHRMPWMKETTFLSPGGGLESTAGAELWAKELMGHLKDMGIGKLGKIAVDSWSSGMFEGFPKAFKDVRFIDGQEIMLGARIIKTWDEIQCLKMGHLMTMAGVQAGLEALKPGVRECDVRAEIFRVMDQFGSEGAQTTNCIVCSGGGTCPYRRFTSDKIIDFGDPVIIDMGASFNNYYGDMTRVYICGKNARPNKRLVELHTKAYNALRLAEKAIRPGGTTYEPGEACGKEYIMGGLLGHGLGVAGVELPFIVAPSPASKAAAQKIEPGMVFSLEPYYGEVGVGGIRLEDVVIVTDTGLEIVSKFPFDERLIDEKLLTF